jgi:hypothetical protein
MLTGTLYTNNKPSILDDYCGVLGNRKPRTAYPTKYMIEDQSGRIETQGTCLVGLCTGVVCGLTG